MLKTKGYLKGASVGKWVMPWLCEHELVHGCGFESQLSHCFFQTT